MKRTIIALTLVICLACVLLVPVSADFDIGNAKQHVVYVEVGFELGGGWHPLSAGSGFFIGKAGSAPQFLMTNNHVISDYVFFGSGETLNIDYISWIKLMCNWFGDWSEDAQNALFQRWVEWVGADTGIMRSKVLLYYSQNESEEAYLVERDEIKDLALLKLSAPTDKRTPAKLCIPTEKSVGKGIHSLGYPGVSDNERFPPATQRGIDDLTATPGGVDRIFAQSGTGTKTIQTSANIQHGHSGGPMILDDNNAVIGINSWGVTNNGESLNYALSMEEVIPVLDRNNVPYMLVSDSFSIPLWAIIAVGVLVIAAVVFLIVRNSNKEPAGKGKTGGDDVTPPPQPIDPTQFPTNHLSCARGYMQGRTFTAGAAPVTFGRNPASTVAFPPDPDGPSRGVSWDHATLYREGGQLMLVDKSSMGTFIKKNGQAVRIEKNVPVPLSIGDVFYIGSPDNRFEITF